MALGEAERGIAKAARYAAFRRDEIGRARRASDVLVRRDGALAVIGVEQRVGRETVNDHLQLPDKIIDVLHAAVGAARTEWRHEMRCIAGKEEASVAKALHAPALERIDARP